MLAEWLEKEASVHLVKTAAQQFEAELAALDAPSIARVWRNAKNKEAQVGQRILQAIPGAVGGSLAGGTLGGIAGAATAPSGERWDAAGKGALLGAGIGGAGGAIRGASVNPERYAALSELKRQLIEELAGTAPQTRRAAQVRSRKGAEALTTLGANSSVGETAGRALGSLSSLGAIGAGAREGLRKRKEKKSSVDFMRLAMLRKAEFQGEG